MKRALVCLALLPLAATGAGSAPPDSRVALQFEASSSRLRPGAAEQLDRLAELRRSNPDARLVLLLPRAQGPDTRRFLAARVAAVDRQLQAHGLAAEHQASDGGDAPDLLWLACWLPSAPDPEPDPPMTARPLVAAAPEWLAGTGATLQSVLRRWTAEAGWTLVWQSRFDYPLEAGASFGGDFVAAASSLLDGFRDAEPQPSAHFYRGNQVLIIR